MAGKAEKETLTYKRLGLMVVIVRGQRMVERHRAYRMQERVKARRIEKEKRRKRDGSLTSELKFRNT